MLRLAVEATIHVAFTVCSVL